MTRILVIDDVDQVRHMLRELLERAGYEVLEATNGEEALLVYRNEPTDLIISDMMMPEKDGLDTIVEIRKEFPSARIIAMTGGGYIGPDGYLDAAKKYGALRTFTKPIDPEKMLRTIKEIIEQC